MPVLLTAVLHPDPDAAGEALRAVGAEPDPRLDLVHEVPGFGRIARRFGTLRNPIGAPAVADGRLLAWFEQILALPKNAALRGRSQTLPYCPVNKTMVRQLAEDQLAGRIHVPWTFRPMNLDVANVVARAHRERPFPYEAFYAQHIQVGAAGQMPTITTGRLFSTPLSGSGFDTMMEPDDDNEVDLRIGLLLEADAYVIL